MLDYVKRKEQLFSPGKLRIGPRSEGFLSCGQCPTDIPNRIALNPPLHQNEVPVPIWVVPTAIRSDSHFSARFKSRSSPARVTLLANCGSQRLAVIRTWEKKEVKETKATSVLEKQSLAGLEWVTPEQAAERLNRSVRRILEFAAAGKLLSARQEDPEAKRQKLKISGSDVERMYAEMHGAKPRDVQPRSESQRPAEIAPSSQSLVLGLLSQLLEKTIAPVPRPWMTLDEASTHVGLSRKLLLGLILSGELPARQEHIKADRWRVHRADLEGLRGARVSVQP